ncbi:MAG TPA: MarR family transcriptional regulator [Candidatus Dormibacteraeota bacterium]|nr:MarR family transcriptional regulator [Candidatus Dormibacteraeota bacterium]
MSTAEEPPVESEVDQEIVARTWGLVGRIWEHYGARVAEFGLSGPEAKALAALRPGESLTMRQLAASTHANPSNVTVVVARLEARGLVRRHGTEDRRVKGVELTPAGVAQRAHLEERMGVEHPALRGLDRLQCRQLLEILRRLTD